MTVPVIECILSYAHVCTWIPALTYVLRANTVLTKIMVYDITNLHSISATGTAMSTLMSPDLPVFVEGLASQTIVVVFLQSLYRTGHLGTIYTSALSQRALAFVFLELG